MDAGPTSTKSTPRRWPRGQKFTLSPAGEAAELGHREAVNAALERVAAYHERQRPQDLRFTDGAGVELGWRWSLPR